MSTPALKKQTVEFQDISFPALTASAVKGAAHALFTQSTLVAMEHDEPFYGVALKGCTAPCTCMRTFVPSQTIVQ